MIWVENHKIYVKWKVRKTRAIERDRDRGLMFMRRGIHEVLGPSHKVLRRTNFPRFRWFFIKKGPKRWDFFFNVIDEELRKKRRLLALFDRNLPIWTPVDSYASHPDTSATGTTSVGSVKSTEMLLMRRFLRENTCKTQLWAKSGARRVKSMFRYCINVGGRAMVCRGSAMVVVA